MRTLFALALCISFTSGHVLPNLHEASQRLAISEDNTPADVKKIPPPGIKLFDPVQTVQVEVEDSISAVDPDPLVQKTPITLDKPVPIIQEVAIPVHDDSLLDEVIKNVQSTPEVLVKSTESVAVDSVPVIVVASVAPLDKSAPLETIVKKASVTIESFPLVKSSPIVQSVSTVVQASEILEPNTMLKKAPEPLNAPNPSIPLISIQEAAIPFYNFTLRDEVVINVQSIPEVLLEQTMPISADSIVVIQAASLAPLVKSVPFETVVKDPLVTIESIPVLKVSPIVQSMASMIPATEMEQADTIFVKAPEPLDAPNPPMPSISIPYVGGQFHAQDELGQYNFGYYGGPSTRIESKDYLGRLSGSFAYINSDGIVHVRKYSSAPGMGFKVEGSDLPVDKSEPTRETEEVLKARAAHMKLINEAKKAHTENADVLRMETKAAVSTA